MANKELIYLASKFNKNVDATNDYVKEVRTNLTNTINDCNKERLTKHNANYLIDYVRNSDKIEDSRKQKVIDAITTNALGKVIR